LLAAAIEAVTWVRLLIDERRLPAAHPAFCAWSSRATSKLLHQLQSALRSLFPETIARLHRGKEKTEEYEQVTDHESGGGSLQRRVDADYQSPLEGMIAGGVADR